MNSKIIEVIPGVGPKTDFTEIEKRVKQVAPYVDWIHIDIADGKLVPNSTFLDPKPFKELLAETSKDFELHMMVKNPLVIAKKWVEAGFDRLIMHVESLSDIHNAKDTMFAMKNAHKDLQIGVALDSDTPVTTVFPFLEAIDTVLVMTIKAGFSGQKFIPELLEKVKVLRSKKYYLPITVDGGINDETGKLAAAAGANRLVSTSYIYNSENIEKAIWTLKKSNDLQD